MGANAGAYRGGPYVQVCAHVGYIALSCLLFKSYLSSFFESRINLNHHSVFSKGSSILCTLQKRKRCFTYIKTKAFRIQFAVFVKKVKLGLLPQEF